MPDCLRSGAWQCAGQEWAKRVARSDRSGRMHTWRETQSPELTARARGGAGGSARSWRSRSCSACSAVGRFGADTINGFDANPANGQDHILLSGFGITTANFASRVTLATVKGTGNTLVTVKDTANVALGTITVVGTTPGNAAGQMTITDFQLA